MQGTPSNIPHTQIHDLLRRTLENAQDVIVVALAVLLLVLSAQTLWRLTQITLLESAAITEVLSEIVFILILTEVYRLLIFYLREHRISVALAVEVALVSTLREMILHGAHKFDWPTLLALSLLLLALGALWAAERMMVGLRGEVRESDAS